MTPDELISRVPVLYHMAADGSWPSIRDHGLLSTTALLDLFEYRGSARRAIESARRPESVVIHHPVLGSAIVRDNKPMREEALRKCLVGMTPRDWYENLNRRCFFWCSEHRLHTMLEALPYRGCVHTVLSFDTSRLLERYVDQVELSSINTGATLYNPAARGPLTFQRLADFPGERKPAELVIPYAVRDAPELVQAVRQMMGRQVV